MPTARPSPGEADHGNDRDDGADAQEGEALSAAHRASTVETGGRDLMPTRSAHAEWNGAIDSGSGRMQFGGYEGPYSFRSRMQDGEGTNPEELIGAAHAGCFSMALSVVLGDQGHAADSITTDAKVKFEQQGEGWAITGIELTTVGKVPGMDEDAFVKAAVSAKENCSVSVAGMPVHRAQHASSPS